MSDDDDDSQKTEDPTPKKLEEARKRGQVPLSKEANTWVILFVATIVIAAMVPGMAVRMTELLRVFIDQSWQMVGVPGMTQAIFRIFLDVLAMLAAPFAIFMLAAAAGTLAQIGPMYSMENIMPKFEKLSPVAGFKRLFSKRSLFEFIKSLLKVIIIGFVSYKALQPYFGQVEMTVTMPMMDMLKMIMSVFLRMMTSILMILLVLSGLDVLFQRYVHMQQMRMTKQEVKDEYKQTEGDPHVKGKLRQIRMERSRKRMMGNVPSATVVVTNPTHFAVALRYDPEEMDAPVCVAKGMDLIALRIRELAEANDVVIFENPPLARTLYKAIEVDEAIPSEHYKAVAEVISYVFRLKKKL